MSVTRRFRAAVASDDAGAVAIIVALVSVLIFGIAALVVDIGAMYARRRAAQTDADFAALAGVTALPQDKNAAFDRAYDYLAKNLPPGGPLGEAALFKDGDLGNGEILFPSATKIRVVVPPRTVEFGFAAVFGIGEADVTAAATAEARSPAGRLPFYLTGASGSGYSCLKDTSGGGGNPGSAMRQVLVAQQPNRPPSITSTSPATLSSDGGDIVTVTGNNFTNPAPDVTSVKVDGTEVTFWTIGSRTSITFSAPPHPIGTATLTVTNAHGTASRTLTYVEPPQVDPPFVTAVSPASGPEAGGTQVTVTGTGFTTATAVTFGTVPAINPTITNDTTIVATSPPGTGAVHVRVTNAGGTSSESTADVFTYEVDACAGVNGSFGYLNIPRGTDPQPQGASAANDLVMINITAGIDHGWKHYPAFTPAELKGPGDPTVAEPAPGTQCQNGNTLIPYALLDNGRGVEGANCIDIQNGNKTNNVGEAFLDGFHKYGVDLDPRLKAPAGHPAVTILGRSGMDGHHITEYLNVPLTQFTTALVNGATPTPGWLDQEIMDCPRFAIVPVLHTDANPGNGFYPIKDFVGVYIDGPSPNHGFHPNNNGTQVESIRAYAFDLDYIGEVAGSDGNGTTTYLGSGPKIPVLVHDAGDPSY
jgi:hypothetical protein